MLDIIPITGASPAADLADWHEVAVAAHAVDALEEAPPWRASREGGLEHPFPGGWQRYYLVRRDGTPVANLRVSGSIEANTVVGHFEGAVHPAYRRQGIGTALLAEAETMLRAEGATKCMTGVNTSLDDGPTRDESGARFLTALGFREVGVETRRGLDLASVTGHDELYEAAVAKAGPDYEIVLFEEPVADEYLPDLAVLNGRLSQDVAGYIEDWEPAPFDVDKLRAYQAAAAARRWRRPHAAIRHVPSGHLVAWAFLAFVSEDGEFAEQGVTVVQPEHRGHGLGMLAKLALHRYALGLQPKLRRIDTWNAAENTHMIAVNIRLGFVPVESFRNFQREL